LRAGTAAAAPAGAHFLFCFRSQVIVTGASSVPSFFCGLYSYLILAKFSENWSVGTVVPPAASPDW
jgi:hypothetical protein